MSEPRRALICGASGLVGRECLQQLVDSNAYGRIVVLTRRDLGAAVAPSKIEQVIVDFDRIGLASDQLVVDDVFCALGTTIKKARTRQRFQEIDFGYPLQIAEMTLDRGAEQFVVVSSMSANPNSLFFYSRVKGDLEVALRAMKWPGLVIVRPSVIGGDRQESRPFEKLGQHVMQIAPRAWRTVPATRIARAMIRAATRRAQGVTVISSREIWAA